MCEGGEFGNKNHEGITNKQTVAVWPVPSFSGLSMGMDNSLGLMVLDLTRYRLMSTPYFGPLFRITASRFHVHLIDFDFISISEKDLTLPNGPRHPNQLRVCTGSGNLSPFSQLTDTVGTQLQL